MKNIKDILTTLILISLMVSCDELLPDDELSINRSNYTGTQLRLDGYYYKYDTEKENKYVNNYFFYRNGIVFSGAYEAVNNINSLEKYYQSGDYYKKNKKYKWRWGVFKIIGDSIAYEQWHPGNPAFEVWTRTGKILNDTTFHISKSMRSDGSEVEKEDELYHFKKLFPKPDSTNNFIN